jgi:hypothetical protein
MVSQISKKISVGSPLNFDLQVPDDLFTSLTTTPAPTSCIVPEVTEDFLNEFFDDKSLYTMPAAKCTAAVFEDARPAPPTDTVSLGPSWMTEGGSVDNYLLEHVTVAPATSLGTSDDDLDNDDDNDEATSSTSTPKRRNGSPKRVKGAATSSTTGVVQYKARRAKNNEAVRKCRERKRQQMAETTARCERLEQENVLMRAMVSELEAKVAALRRRLLD